MGLGEVGQLCHPTLTVAKLAKVASAPALSSRDLYASMSAQGQPAAGASTSCMPCCSKLDWCSTCSHQGQVPPGPIGRLHGGNVYKHVPGLRSAVQVQCDCELDSTRTWVAEHLQQQQRCQHAQQQGAITWQAPAWLHQEGHCIGSAVEERVRAWLLGKFRLSQNLLPDSGVPAQAGRCMLDVSRDQGVAVLRAVRGVTRRPRQDQCRAGTSGCVVRCTKRGGEAPTPTQARETPASSKVPLCESRRCACSQQNCDGGPV